MRGQAAAGTRGGRVRRAKTSSQLCGLEDEAMQSVLAKGGFLWPFSEIRSLLHIACCLPCTILSNLYKL